MHMNAHPDGNGLHLSCAVLAGFDLALPEEKRTINNRNSDILGQTS